MTCATPLMDPSCPTIVGCWALKKAGWVPATRKCVHDSLALSYYDAYEAVTFKGYYQVLHRLHRYLPLTSKVPSRQPKLFYQLLLHEQKVEPDLGHKRYMEMWKALLDSGAVVPALEAPESEEEAQPQPIEDGGADDGILIPFGKVPEPNPKKRRTATPPVGEGGASSSSGHPGANAKAKAEAGPPQHLEPPVPPTAPPLPPPMLPPPIVIEPESEDGVLVPALAEEPPEPMRRGSNREDVAWRDSIGGYRVRYDPDYVTPQGVAFKANWQIRCTCPGHPARCGKQRSVTLEFTAACGPIECLAFLHVWATTEPAPNKNHRRTDPEQEEVVAYATAHKDELEEVYRRCVPAPLV